MRILIFSTVTWPQVGGTERVVELLANEFARAFQSEVVISTVKNGPEICGVVPIHRHSSFAGLLRDVRWADVILQFGMDLRHSPLFFLSRKPLVVTHHSWYVRPNGRRALRDRVKRQLCHLTRNLAPSHALASDLGAHCDVISNPFDDQIFFEPQAGMKRRGIVFVGRLLEDKGVATLLDALIILKKQQVESEVTIVGDGPELGRLQEQVRTQGLSEQVRFTGSLSPIKVADELRAHQVIVVPSWYPETFGIVALEGLACGCHVIASAEGGLPEAFGEFGDTFPVRDAHSLAMLLKRALCRSRPAHSNDDIRAFLKERTTAAVARRYYAVLEAELLKR